MTGDDSTNGSANHSDEDASRTQRHTYQDVREKRKPEFGTGEDEGHADLKKQKTSDEVPLWKLY